MRLLPNRGSITAVPTKKKATATRHKAKTAPALPLLVSKKSFEAKTTRPIVESNISVVNAMFSAMFEPEEISRDALRSYYVDYYDAQVKNGGMAQFVFNSRASALVLELVREGLVAMGAKAHLALFDKLLGRIVKLGKKKLETFFDSQFFGKNVTRDVLNEDNDTFFALSEKDDLSERNGRWLRKLPHVVPMTTTKLEKEIASRAMSFPDIEARIAAAQVER